MFISQVDKTQRPSVSEFMALHPEYIQKDNSMAFLSDNGGESYNLCHCMCFWVLFLAELTIPTQDWSNFEIADMDFWRGEVYQKFFEYLESKGGFYYEVSIPF